MTPAQLYRSRIGVLSLLLLSAAAAIGGYLCGMPVAGPFIFADESTYFQLARNFAAGGGLSGHTQYGPLYPVLTSVFFALPDDVTTYKAIRLFNLVCFASISLPIYLLCRQLTERTVLCLVAASAVLVMPYGAFAHLIWAEPVFFPAIAWVFYLYFRYSRQQSAVSGLYAGIAIGVGFLLKPAGIILAVAAGVVELGKLYAAGRDDRPRLLHGAAGLFLGIGLLTAPWIIRNALLTDGGALGYPGTAAEMRSRVAEIGVPAFAGEVALSVFYQASYIVWGTFGLISALIVTTASRWRRLPLELRLPVCFLFITMLGMILLSAVHMTAYRVLGYHFPNGRYYCTFFPFVFLFYIAAAFGSGGFARKEVWWSVLAAAVSFAIIVLATPLLVLAPVSIVNNPELSVFMLLFDGKQIIWRGLFEPALWQRLALGIGIAAAIGLSLLAIRFRVVRPAVLALLVATIAFMGAESHRYVTAIGATQTASNRAISFAVAKRKDQQVFFDPALKGKSINFIMETWSGRSETKYIDAGLLISQLNVLVPAKNQVSAVDPSVSAAKAFYISPRQLNFPVAYASGWLSVYEIGSSR